MDNGWRAPHWYGTAFTPAGTSTYTTAEDMMKYARAVVERQAPGLAALEPVADADQGRIGLAWMTLDVSGRTLDLAQRRHRRIQRVMLALDRDHRPSRPGARTAPPRSGRRSRLQLAAAASVAELQSHPPTRGSASGSRRPPRRSACSWYPARSPCSEPGIGSLPSRCRHRRRRTGDVARARAVGPAAGRTVVGPGRAGPSQHRRGLAAIPAKPVGPKVAAGRRSRHSDLPCWCWWPPSGPPEPGA